jgi:hypothetical protein
MLLGTPSLYMISLMNSTTLVVVVEAVDFTLIHFVNLSTAIKMCVNPPLALLNGPTRSNPHNEKGQVIGIVEVFYPGNHEPSAMTHKSGYDRFPLVVNG